MHDKASDLKRKLAITRALYFVEVASRYGPEWAMLYRLAHPELTDKEIEAARKRADFKVQ